MIKFDYLVLSTLSIQTQCFKLLQQHGVIDANLTLKQCYERYIFPDVIDFSDKRIWDNLYNNETLAVFQWDKESGRKGILATHPENLDEMSSVNGLIRLISEGEGETQLERFCRMKKNPFVAFEEEMQRYELPDDVRFIMHEELDRYNGCAATQESFMILCQRIAGYSLAEADKVRKIIAKKKMDEIDQLRSQWKEKCPGDERQKQYLYDVILKPSEGYAFAKAHADAYSIIGVQCLLLGGILFPAIYWQTAMLLQSSGSLDGKATDYNKIANAVTAIRQLGVTIKPVDINKSQREFTLNAEEEAIYFGLDGVKGLKKNTIEAILEQRPFINMMDFISKTKADITSIITLIKAGAFDEFHTRQEAIDMLAECRAETKQKLNGQNLIMINRLKLWPEDTEELQYARRAFNFTQYIKKLPNWQLMGTEYDISEYYPLDERACKFLDEIEYKHNGVALNKAEWKYQLDVAVRPMKQYLIDNQIDMLDKVNNQILQDWKAKYWPHDVLSYYEIETLGINFSKHPLTHVVKGLSNFYELPETPTIKSIFTAKSGRNVPLYELSMICGICIAKDKMHSLFTLLTADGPVEVKMRKEQFAHYDSQISQIQGEHKKIIEKSWLNRGNALIVHGMRQDDTFIAKTYKNSPMKHVLYKIIQVHDDGHCDVQKERKKGKEETDDSNE